jgi:hypothetical protein
VHRIAKYSKKDQVNQEIEENGYYPPFNTSFYKENDKDFYNNYTQNPLITIIFLMIILIMDIITTNLFFPIQILLLKIKKIASLMLMLK